MRVARSSLAPLALAGFLACDQGEPTDLQPTLREVHLVGSNVSTTRPLASDGDVELVFDRLLLPISVTRQSLALVDAFNQARTPVLRYDPLRRRVILANPEPSGKAWLDAGQPYRVVLGIPDGTKILGGLRAIDGAKIQRGSTRQVGFFATKEAGPRTKTRTNYCGEIAPLFREKCATCHGASKRELGLDLSSVAGIRETALRKVARASVRGGLATQALNPDLHFGDDMALVDPGSPGTSYLLYVLLVDDEVGAPATFACGGIAERARWSLSEEERATLRARVFGHTRSAPALTSDEISAISEWIADGAELVECAGCAPL